MAEALNALREIPISRNVIITVAGARSKCSRGWSGSPNPIAPSDIYQARDQGWIVIAVISASMFFSLMAVMGRQDRADDLALVSNDGRVAHESTIDAVISAVDSRARRGRPARRARARRGAVQSQLFRGAH